MKDTIERIKRKQRYLKIGKRAEQILDQRMAKEHERVLSQSSASGWRTIIVSIFWSGISWVVLVCFCFFLWGTEPRVLHVVGKHPTAELHLSPRNWLF